MLGKIAEIVQYCPNHKSSNVHADHVEKSVKFNIHAKAFSGVGGKQECTYCCPYLCFDGIFIIAKKCFNPEVLLDPLEK